MYNLAFAGFRHGHINSLYTMASERQDITIKAAFEQDAAARADAEEKLGVKFTHSDYDQMLADPDIDLIAIGDYYGIRGQRVIAALKAGKHVISDKPLCTSLAELAEIEQLAREKGLKVGLMLDLRYHEAVQPVKEIIQSGQLGQIHAIFFGGQHPLNYGTRPQWYFETGKHGGTINDIAIHGVDLVTDMTGLVIEDILAARCWNAFASKEPHFEDSAQFMAKLSNGAGLVADVSYAAPDTSGFSLPQYWRFTIWGTEGVVEFSVGTKEIWLSLKGSTSLKTVAAAPGPVGDCLSDFLADIAGEESPRGTASVLAATRSTLEVQALADQAR